MVLGGFGEWAGQGLLGLGVWMLVLGGLGFRVRWGGVCGWISGSCYFFLGRSAGKKIKRFIGVSL